MTRARDVANIDGLLTTTGDTYYASAAGTPARLGIGSTSQVLTVASGVPSWATPAVASSALTLVKAETAFSAVANTSTTFDGVFTSTYNNYLIIINETFASVDDEAMNFNLRYSTGTTDSDGCGTGITYTKNSGGGDTSWYFNNATAMKLMANANNNGRKGPCILNVGGFNSGSASRAQFNWQIASGNNTGGVGAMYRNQNGTERIWTGFILTAASGTISGKATVYGYGKA
jgi:hypothetical protein